MNLAERYRKRFGLKPGITLRGYQLKATAVGVKNSSYALLMAPRLGKTRVDIAVTGYRRQVDKIQRWVIICPAIAKAVWRNEISATLGLPYHLEIIEGKKEEKKLMIKGWEDQPGKLSIIIINFEALYRFRKFLYKLNPDKITIDESHRIKDHASQQSRTIHSFGKRAAYRSILTGTFISSPRDVFSQYKFLEPSIFGTVWKSHPRKPKTSFCGRYVASWGHGGFKPETYHRLDELREKYQSIAYSLTREEAGGFPQEQVQIIHFELTNPAARHYLEMEQDLITTVNGQSVGVDIILTKALRLQQLTGGFLPIRDPDEAQVNAPLGEDKLKALVGILEEYPLDEPLVIFVRFIFEMKAILTQLDKMKRSASYIAGGMTGRDKVIADFQAGRFHTCVVQIRAGGVAVELSRANTAIFYSLTHSFIDYEQAKARIISRSGGTVSLIHLAAQDTVDDEIIAAVQNKQELATRLQEKYLENKS